MNIRCGNCKGTHTSVNDVRECFFGETFDEPVEVCCGICDALKGYAYSSKDYELLNRTGCGCDGLAGQVRPRTYDEVVAEHKHFKCNCPPSYSMCKMHVIAAAENGRLDGTRNGTNGGVGHGGWTGYGNQLEVV